MLDRDNGHLSFYASVGSLTLQVLDLFGRLFGLLVVTSPLIVKQRCRQSGKDNIFFTMIKSSMVDQDNNV